MGAAAIDPIEPPPQGDVELEYVRREYGRELVLFGNLEMVDIENCEPVDFEKVVEKALIDGTSGEGRGFVLMPNVKLPIEMMNLTIAARAYQANAAVLKRYQKMIETTLELLR